MTILLQLRYTGENDPKKCAYSMQSGVSNYVLKASLDTWHNCLGHINKDYVQSTQESVEEMQITLDGEDPKAADFVDFLQFKMKQQHFLATSQTNTFMRGSLDLVHTDIAYALPETIEGFHYFLVLVDDYSRYMSVFPLHSKTT